MKSKNIQRHESVTYLRRRKLMVLSSMVQGLKILKATGFPPSLSLSSPERKGRKRGQTDVQKNKRASEYISRMGRNW